MTSYTSTIEQLLALSKVRKNHTSLAAIKQVSNQYGHPENSYPSVHVAGTNGKGSVSIKIARSLQEEGYTTGLYTSPHVSSFRERIQINGVLISKKMFASLFAKVQKTFPALTLFEMTTAIAFLYFKEKKVDIAVIETGLGGLLDPTNICSPILSIITSIGYDHTDLLGNSLQEITDAKAGIIKTKTPVLLGPSVQASFIEKTATTANAPLHQNKKKDDDYEEENKETARLALKLLDPFFPTSLTSQEKGLAQNLPCRFEVFSFEKTVILDASHNPDGFAALLKKLNKTYPNHKYRFLLAFSKGKDFRSSIHLLKDHPIHLLEPSNPLLEDPSQIASFFSFSLPIEKSIELFIKASDKKEILIIAGSFFIMDRAKTAILTIFSIPQK